ncbi:MAG: flagellar basal body L-ring protein FlgH [Epsilonproteobacteria bacterium]|nr:MAG: flagellar basal body L-ring protein FlgH [Campylobacterota bacterium]
MKRKILTILTPLCLSLLLDGCSMSLMDPEIDFKPPKYVEEMPAKENDRSSISTGSIFGQGENPLFSDHKAMHVNDIVRVVISENANSSNTASKQLSGSDSSTLGGGTFTATGGSKHMTKYADKLNSLSNIGFESKSSSAFKGAGSATKNASFTTTVSARIVKVLINGNYFISGKREILIDKQKQTIQISGVIRPYDIDQYNKIDSAQMSEAKILYKMDGDVDRATEQGWGTKLVQAIWPF